MPIMTMLVSMRPSLGAGHSPNWSRACMIWPTISEGSRLRTRRWVPVWQKRQVSVQPTWEETQSVPRSSSGMWTVSNCWPSAIRSSHLAVPSDDLRSRLTSGRSMKKCSASCSRTGFASVVITSNVVAPR